MRLRKGTTWAPWTTEDDELIRRWGGENKSRIRIAARLNRSTASVKRRASELGVKLKGRRAEIAEARGRLKELEKIPGG
jgi:hypothetical protein